MDCVSLEGFAPLCGEPFSLSLQTDPPLLHATLIEAKPLPQPAFNGRQPFSLLFAGPPAPLLPQSIYRVAHQGLPALDMFLVPVAADATGVRYQAVFS